MFMLAGLRDFRYPQELDYKLPFPVPSTRRNPCKIWAQRDLNPRPSDYESPALTTELWAQQA